MRLPRWASWALVRSKSSPVRPHDIVNGFLREPGGSELLSDADGSATPVVFSFPAHPDYSATIIDEVRIAVVDKGITPSGFAGEAALTNGLRFFATELDSDDVETEHELVGFNVTANWQFSMFADGTIEITSDPQLDAYIPVWNYARDPLELHPGEKVAVEVNDDLTAIGSGNPLGSVFVRASGYYI